MTKHLINIPDEDLPFFLELTKKMKWKFETDSVDGFELSQEQKDLLDEISQLPDSEFISAEDFFKDIDEL